MPRRCLVASALGRLTTYQAPTEVADHRRRLLGGARGRVLDLSLRPEANRAALAGAPIDELTVVAGGPAPAGLWMSVPAEGRPGGSVGDARLMTGPLHADSFDVGSFDTVISVLTLCTVEHLPPVLQAVARWLAPGGRLLLLEHVRATGFTGLAQSLATPLERQLVGGCHLDQDVLGACRTSELELTDVLRFSTRLAGTVPVPVVAATARPRARNTARPRARKQGKDPA